MNVEDNNKQYDKTNMKSIDVNISFAGNKSVSNFKTPYEVYDDFKRFYSSRFPGKDIPDFSLLYPTLTPT